VCATFECNQIDQDQGRDRLQSSCRQSGTGTIPAEIRDRKSGKEIRDRHDSRDSAAHDSRTIRGRPRLLASGSSGQPSFAGQPPNRSIASTTDSTSTPSGPVVASHPSE